MCSRTRGWWKGVGILPLAWAVLALALPARLVGAAEEGTVPAEKGVPADRAVLEVQAPAGAAVHLDGEDQGEKRTFAFSGLRPGRYETHEVRVRFKDGEAVERRALLRGGWRVRLPLHGRAELAARPELVVQTGHTGSIRAVAFSPDGRYILTGSQDTTAALWEAATGRKIRTFQGHKAPGDKPAFTGKVAAVAFSPDGKYVLTGSEDRTAALWEADTGRQVRTFRGHTHWVYSVAFSPDGQYVLTGATDGTAALWETSSGKKIRTFEGVGGRAAISPDGKHVLTTSNDNTAALWETDSGRKIRTFQGHTDWVFAVAYSPDGKHVMTASKDRTAALWEADTGRQVRTFGGRARLEGAVAVSPDGKHVLTSFEDKTTVLWETETGKQVRTFQGHARRVEAVAFSPDGKHVLTGSADGTAALWETGSGQQVRTFEGHTGSVRAMAVRPDGKRVLTWDRTAALWDTDTGRLSRTFQGESSGMTAAAYSPDGKWVLTGCYDLMATLWEAGSGKKSRTFEGHTGSVTAVTFSPDGKHVLTGSWDRTAVLWEAGSGRQIRTFKGHDGQVYAVAFSPDGKHVLTGSMDQTAALWEAASGEKIRTFRGHSYAVNAVAYSADGKYVLTGSHDKTAALWEADSGRKIHTLQSHTNSVNAVAFSPDGKYVLTGSHDKTAVLWDAETGKQVWTFQGHTDSVLAVAFSPDGKHVLTASGDGTTRLWDVATGDELARLLSLDAGKDWLVVTPDGLFDGSLGGREKVAFRVGNGLTVLPVERFFQDFYHPGLLAELLHGLCPMPEVSQRLQRPPTVRIVRPQRGGVVAEPEAILEVEAIDQGDGVRGPWLLHNGARVLAPGEASREGKIVRRRFTVSLVQGDNSLLVQAASASGSPESEPATLTLRHEKTLARPDLYVLAVGVNRYKQEAMNLKYAAADARAFADLFQRRGKGGLYADVRATTLLDDRATRAGLRKELEAIAKQARPQDTLLVFLAGHGSTLGQRYFFIPHEFTRSEGKALEDDVRKQGVPGDELADHLGAVPALKRVLVLDTCQSGGALALRRGRDPFALRGAVERLSRSQGVFTIAAAAAGEEAQEVQELGHGVLTYALLAGLKGVEGGPLEGQSIKPSNPERIADVLEWFSFASGQVPRLTKKYFGREQDVQSGGQGNSFPLLPVEEK
jgi:WD40 repeat protein